MPLALPPFRSRHTLAAALLALGLVSQAQATNFFVTTTPDGRTYLAVRTGAPPSGGSSPSPDTQIYPSQMATLPLNDTPQQGMPSLSGVTLAPNPLVDAIAQNLTDIANANRALLNAPAGTAAPSTVPVSLSDEEAQALLQALQQQPNLSPEQQAQINELITQLSGSAPAAPPPAATNSAAALLAQRKAEAERARAEAGAPATPTATAEQLAKAREAALQKRAAAQSAPPEPATPPEPAAPTPPAPATPDPALMQLESTPSLDQMQQLQSLLNQDTDAPAADLPDPSLVAVPGTEPFTGPNDDVIDPQQALLDLQLQDPGFQATQPPVEEPFNPGDLSPGEEPYNPGDLSPGEDPFNPGDLSPGEDPFNPGDLSPGEDPFNPGDLSPGEQPFDPGELSPGELPHNPDMP